MAVSISRSCESNSYENRVEVRWAALDPYNHVNHSVYLVYFETGRANALSSIGLGLGELASSGFQFVVADLNIKYRSPALLGDELTVRSCITSVSKASCVWHQHIFRGEVLLSEAEIKIAVTGKDGRLKRIPSWLIEKLKNLHT